MTDNNSAQQQSFVAPNGQTVTTSDLVSLYKEYAMIPSPKKAYITTPSNNSNDNVRYVTVEWSTRDCEQVDVGNHTKVYRLDLSNVSKVSVEKISNSIDTSSVVMTSVSRSGQRVANLKTKSKDGKDKQYIDIIVDSWKVKSIDIDSLDSTGQVITKYPFGGMVWSPNELYLAIVCEAKVPKSESFFSPKKSTSSDKHDDAKSGPRQGDEYIYREDWGEALDGVIHPVVLVLNVEKVKVEKVIDVSNYSLLNPIWSSVSSILFIGVKEESRKLGVIYCTNRPTVLYMWAFLNEEPTVVYDGNSTIRCLRSSPSGSRVVFLENEPLGPHHKASKLILMDTVSGSREVLVDLEITRNPDLKALYVDDLPLRCSSFIVFHTISFGQKRIVKVDVNSKAVSTVSFGSTPDVGRFVLDFDGKVLVGSHSTINQRSHVWVSLYHDGSWSDVVKLEDQVVEKDLEYIKGKIPTDEPELSIQSFLVSPKNVESSSAPCFVCIHGGPHSSFCDTFMSPLCMFARLGFKSLLINYRGSSGFDEKMVNSLPDHIGSKDVLDCVKCVDHFVEKGLIDRQNLILYGGSHGGFLVTHLSGQFAHYDWLACATRNPVIDLVGMTEGTDIPDWCWIEAIGRNFVFDRIPTNDELLGMAAKSPIRYVNQVKTPTIVFLGSNDRRVPMTQGLKWYRLLKARGVNTKCVVYKDKHDLYKVEVDSDYFVNAMLWVLKEYDEQKGSTAV